MRRNHFISHFTRKKRKNIRYSFPLSWILKSLASLLLLLLLRHHHLWFQSDFSFITRSVRKQRLEYFTQSQKRRLGICISVCVLQPVCFTALVSIASTCAAYPTMCGCSEAQGSWQTLSRGPPRPSVTIRPGREERGSTQGDWRKVWHQSCFPNARAVDEINNSTENKTWDENLLQLSGESANPGPLRAVSSSNNRAEEKPLSLMNYHNTVNCHSLLFMSFSNFDFFFFFTCRRCSWKHSSSYKRSPKVYLFIYFTMY